MTRNELDDARDRLFLVGVSVADARADADDGVAPQTVLERLVDAIDAIAGENPAS